MSVQAPLAHRVEGAGTPVVLLNGGMMTFASWEPVAARLRNRHALLRFDFRGQLLSPGVVPVGLAGHADDARDLLDTVGWESAHLVGASFGALAALELACRSPRRVRSLTLVTAMDVATEGFRAQSAVLRGRLAEIAAGADRGVFWDEMVAGVYSSEHRVREATALAARRAQLDLLPAHWFDGVDRLLVAVDGFDFRARLAGLGLPALVVAAADDRVMDLERSRSLAAALAADCLVHPTSGHALVAEDPAWLARVCGEFIDSLESSRP